MTNPCSKSCGREARVGQRYCKECHSVYEKARRRAIRAELLSLRAQVSILKHGGSLAGALGLKTVA